MEKKVLTYIRSRQLFSPGDRILIGVSGGADSLALLYFLISYQEVLGIAIGAAHLHHDMRGASADADASFVRDFCARYQVPFYFEKQNVNRYAEEHKVGVEVAGRQLRYAFFERIMSEQGYDLLATAHHGDDQTETVLMRLIRGTGIKGAAGIRPKEGNRIRPLLCVSRTEIEDYCHVHHLDFRHDCTNDDLNLTRNRIRHLLMPQLRVINPAVSEHIVRFSEIASEYEDLLTEIVRSKSNELITMAKDRCTADVDILAAEHHLIRTALLREMIHSVSGSLVDIESTHITQIDVLLCTRQDNWTTALPRRIVVMRRYDRLIVTLQTEAKILEPVQLIDIDSSEKQLYVGGICFKYQLIAKNDLRYHENEKNRSIARFNYDKINKSMEFRMRQTGDIIFLKGMQGRKKIKDLMIDRKIPREERDQLPLLASGSEILWVPGLAINSKYSVEENTQQILQISMESKHEQRC